MFNDYWLNNGYRFGRSDITESPINGEGRSSYISKLIRQRIDCDNDYLDKTGLNYNALREVFVRNDGLLANALATPVKEALGDRIFVNGDFSERQKKDIDQLIKDVGLVDAIQKLMLTSRIHGVGTLAIKTFYRNGTRDMLPIQFLSKNDILAMEFVILSPLDTITMLVGSDGKLSATDGVYPVDESEEGLSRPIMYFDYEFQNRVIKQKLPTFVAKRKMVNRWDAIRDFIFHPSRVFFDLYESQHRTMGGVPIYLNKFNQIIRSYLQVEQVANDMFTYGAKPYVQSLQIAELAAKGMVNSSFNCDLSRKFNQITSKDIAIIDSQDTYSVVPLNSSGLPVVLEKAIELFAGHAGVPINKLIGTSAQGFSSGDDSIRNYASSLAPIHRKASDIARKVLIPLAEAALGLNLTECTVSFSGIEEMQKELENAEKNNQVTQILEIFNSGLLDVGEAKEMINQTNRFDTKIGIKPRDDKDYVKDDGVEEDVDKEGDVDKED